jgi:hypothetical protein
MPDALIDSDLTAGAWEFVMDGLPSVRQDQTGFDEFSGTILYRGTVAQLMAEFPGGSAPPAGWAAPSGSSLFCVGPVGAPRASWEHVETEILFKGFYASRTRVEPGLNFPAGGTNYVTEESEPTGLADSNWPVETQLAGGGQFISYVPPSWIGKATVNNPATGAPWKVRLSSETHMKSYRGVSIVATGITVRAPTLTASAPLGVQNFSGMIDPVYNYPDGWVCVSFNPSSSYEWESRKLVFWEATFEWRPDYGP